MNKSSVIVFVIVLLVIVAAAIYFFMPKNNNVNTGTSTASLSGADQNQQTQTQNPQSPTTFNIQGMKVEILKQGSGDGAKPGDSVTVNYTGTLTDGTKFDSSVDPAFNHVSPFQFTLGQGVIEGWSLGVEGMKVGETRKLTIPPELAYGSQSPSPLIPANSTLVFQIDLLAINGQ